MRYLNENGDVIVAEFECMGCDNIFIVSKASGECICPDCKTKTKYKKYKNGRFSKRNMGEVKED